MKFINILLELINKKGITKNKLLTDLQLGKNSFVNWTERETIPNGETLEKISKYFDVSIEYLLGKETSSIKLPPNIFPVNISDYVKIPVYGTVSAGLGCLAENLIESYEPFSLDSIRHRKEDYFCLIVDGDSMYPKLEEGDYILVKKQCSVDSGAYAVLLIDGEEGVAKKVIYGDDWIELHSINPMYKVRRFDGEEVQRIRVVGKITEIKRKL